MIAFIGIIAVGLAVYMASPSNTSFAITLMNTLTKLALAAWIILAGILSAITTIFLPTFTLPITIGFLAASVIMIIIVSAIIKTQINTMRDKVRETYPALSSLLKVNGIKSESEYETFFTESIDNVKIEKSDDGKITEISVVINSIENLNEAMVTKSTELLEKFFGQVEKAWCGRVDFQNRRAEFRIQRSIPSLAEYPGVDFRSPVMIEVGVSGVGASCWKLSDGDPGMSSFFYKDGEHAKTVKVSSCPQALVLGSTGGGKAIFVDQYVEVMKIK